MTHRPPGSIPVARQQLVRRLRAVAAGVVVREFSLLRRPGVEHRLHDAPSLLHHVGTHEERRVADHDVIDQRLVSDIRLLREPVIVVEVHLHGGEVHHRPTALDLELQGDPLVRRDAQHQPVGPQGVDGRVLERRVGRLLEADGDLRIPLRHVLAGTEVEGHAGPAPVVDLELHRDIGLDVRIRRHIRLFPIGIHLLAQHCAGAILAAHRPCRLDGGHRGEHFGLLRADRSGIEARWRLHGHHRKEREHVVRDHVAERPGRLVEPAALLHAHRLRHGDLHVIDPVAVPDRFEQPIGETERHNALDRVLSQKVVDPEDLVLVQRAQDAGIQLARRVQAMAERLFDHHAAPELRLPVLVLTLIGQLRLAELLHHGTKEPVGDGEIEDDVTLRAMGLLCLAQRRHGPSRTARAW